MKTRNHKTQDEKEGQTKKSEARIITLIWVCFLVSVIAYIAANVFLKVNIAALGILALIFIIAGLIAEFRVSLRQEGGKKTIIEIGAVILVVIILFVAVAVILQTSSPIDVVASCSMLPNLHRGDLVILHGIPNMTDFLQSKGIPVVNVPQTAFNNMVNSMQNEFIEPFAYEQANPSVISDIIQSNLSRYSVGFYNLECIAKEPSSAYDKCMVSQQGNLIKYNYSVARLATIQGNASIVYVSGITIGTTTVSENYSNPTIVYKTTKLDYFTGDIIHRAFAAIKVGSQYYLLTKGDNNPVLDIESLNYPVNQTDVIGYVIADVPYLGYPSLIIKGQVGTVAGCNETIVRN